MGGKFLPVRTAVANGYGNWEHELVWGWHRNCWKEFSVFFEGIFSSEEENKLEGTGDEPTFVFTCLAKGVL